MLAHRSKDIDWSELAKSSEAGHSTHFITDATMSTSSSGVSSDKQSEKRSRYLQLWERYASVTTLHGITDAQLTTGRCGTWLWLTITAFMTTACVTQLYSLVRIDKWQLELVFHALVSLSSS